MFHLTLVTLKGNSHQQLSAANVIELLSQKVFGTSLASFRSLVQGVKFGESFPFTNDCAV